MQRKFFIAYFFLFIAFRSALSMPLPLPLALVDGGKVNESGLNVKKNEQGHVSGLEEQIMNERENRGVVGEAVVSRPGLLEVLPFRGKIIAKVGEKVVVGLIKKVVKTAWSGDEKIKT